VVEVDGAGVDDVGAAFYVVVVDGAHTVVDVVGGGGFLKIVVMVACG
jgi:hypothetical protein